MYIQMITRKENNRTTNYCKYNFDGFMMENVLWINAPIGKLELSRY